MDKRRATDQNGTKWSTSRIDHIYVITYMKNNVLKIKSERSSTATNARACSIHSPGTHNAHVEWSSEGPQKWLNNGQTIETQTQIKNKKMNENYSYLHDSSLYHVYAFSLLSVRYRSHSIVAIVRIFFWCIMFGSCFGRRWQDHYACLRCSLRSSFRFDAIQ